MRKIMFVLVLLMAMTAGIYGQANAADIWLNGYTVSQVNAVGSEVAIRVTNGTNVLNRYVTATEANRFMAMALTAISLNSTIDICVDSTTGRYTQMVIRSE